MSTFNLTIELGNAAMEDMYDVAQALHALAERMSAEHYPTEGKIRDLNGNTVGSWELS